jgi:hypothetical protein
MVEAHQCEVPIAEDRDIVLYTLRDASDKDVSELVVPALFAHFESISLWVTGCDPGMLADPQGYFEKKLALISAMSEDASAFLARGVPAAVCETEEETQAIGRAAIAARWLLRFAGNLALLATMPPADSADTHQGNPRHNVKQRWDEYSKAATAYLSAPDKYTYNPSTQRNCMNPENIDAFKDVVHKAEAEVGRLASIQHALRSQNSTPPGSSGGRTPVNRSPQPSFTPPTPGAGVPPLPPFMQLTPIVRSSSPVFPAGLFAGSPNGASNGATKVMTYCHKEPHYFNPPLAHFVMLKDICYWAYTVACQDFHAHLLYNQQVIFAGLKMRLAQVRRALPTMRSGFTPAQRKEVFEAIDQLHYDATQFLHHLEAEALKANTRNLNATIRGAAHVRASARSWLQMMCCQPEILHHLVQDEDRDALDDTADRAAHQRRVKQRAKTMQLLSMTTKVISDTCALRQQMDRCFPDEYASGLHIRASRAAVKMMHWAQSATVVFDSPAHTPEPIAVRA